MKIKNTHNQNKMEKQPTRPWQGVGLVLIYLIPLFYAFIFMIKTSISTQSLEWIDPTYFLFFIIPMSILIVVLSIGVFRGRKIAVKGILALTILSILSNLNHISQFSTNIIIKKIILIFVTLWLIIICLKHPFYNKK
ncbi:hypothetical protein KKC45_02085 [Patescibacteria group bacterium]|nr:hypothetical protein [Patescibacteria group bacterium]